ncbi:uncharacterized protein LOC113380966 [Ctenocephalides felis]|uniref:uncharacterized protein LOC113380420 n=1 Tax=Ctenocephalides felis TaxID=7515 RepID=UPI000E6E5472|nr:uncharacterized protein LOC113380420 [Ctenocephalides felis]XP_026475770.1 uncharacterized protein LOC113380966 [Ctenocephalides felis]
MHKGDDLAKHVTNFCETAAKLNDIGIVVPHEMLVTLLMNPRNCHFKKAFPRINEAVNYGTNMINKNRYEVLSYFQEQEINIDQSRLMLMNKPRRIMERRQTENGRYIQMNNRNLKQTSEERNSQRREYCGKIIEIEEIRKSQIIHEELVKKLGEKIRNKECDDLEEVVNEKNSELINDKAVEEVVDNIAPFEVGDDIGKYLKGNRATGSSGKEILLKIINKYWLSPNEIPDWNKYRIILIKKKSNNSDDSNAYRPITLASCIAKIKDRMIKRRVEWWIENNQLLPKSQFGFRKGLSTQDSLSIFSTDIHLAFSRNTYVVALFCDIKRAYDNVVPGKLAGSLVHAGLPEKLINAMIYSTFHREIVVKPNENAKIGRVLRQGLP